MNSQNIIVEELEGLSNQQSSNVIAQHFAEVSNEYQPLNVNDLPCYLPAEKPPQMNDFEVYEKITS